MQKAKTLDAGAEFDALFASAKLDHAAEIAATPNHYATDCLWINAECERIGPDSIPGIVALVLASIQQSFHLMPNVMPDIAKYGTRSRFMWGWKPAGLEYARANKREIFLAIQRYRRDSDLVRLIVALMAIDGLGIVKASFLAQLTVGNGACLDTLNLQHLGMPLDTFKTSKTLTPQTVLKKIEAYNAIWQASGDSAHWWNAWCDRLASRDTIATSRTRLDGTRIARAVGGVGVGTARPFKTGAEASACHRLAITAKVR